ncbi:MAG: hypothetical protein ACI915_002616 [Gammaproteobacteria bacterium]|jgi:hypothetical protein
MRGDRLIDETGVLCGQACVLAATDTGLCHNVARKDVASTVSPGPGDLRR